MQTGSFVKLHVFTHSADSTARVRQTNHSKLSSSGHRPGSHYPDNKYPRVLSPRQLNLACPHINENLISVFKPLYLCPYNILDGTHQSFRPSVRDRHILRPVHDLRTLSTRELREGHPASRAAGEILYPDAE